MVIPVQLLFGCRLESMVKWIDCHAFAVCT
uniref:Uncharacterized protein n=1 Tax=Arundo donax TaxID=35708 RepID=A0A0A9BXW6_ARUDO